MFSTFVYRVVLLRGGGAGPTLSPPAFSPGLGIGQGGVSLECISHKIVAIEHCSRWEKHGRIK